MNSTYFFPKFTFWCAEVATTIINTSQPPPPVSTQGPPQVIHRLHTGAELSTGSNVGTDLAIAQLMPTREATKVGTDIA